MVAGGDNIPKRCTNNEDDDKYRRVYSVNNETMIHILDISKCHFLPRKTNRYMFITFSVKFKIFITMLVHLILFDDAKVEDRSRLSAAYEHAEYSR